MDKAEPVCWRCKQTGHLKWDCPMPPYCSKCRQEGHIPAKCPQKNKRTSIPRSPAGQPQAPMDQQFSNPNNKCLHCGGNHRSAVCPTQSQHQPTPSASSCVSSADKPHVNMSPKQGTKNSQSTACSTTSTLLVNNPAQTPRHDTGNNIPQASPQVTPNVPQHITTICLMLSHHPCKYLTSFRLHLISRSHFHRLLLHPLMYQQPLQLLHQTFQQLYP